MQLTYKYRLKPTKAQLTTIAAHLLEFRLNSY
ncbi:MAG: helix-turn-helix domain-containing protein [Microcoleus sp.]